jgi:maltooligosyltrehalose synthase
MLLQMVVGAWPLDLAPRDDVGRAAFAARLAQWQEKELREAKLVTDWALPNEPYEAAARQLVTSLVADNAIPELLSEVAAFVDHIAAAGAVNGLAQTLLKLVVPGVPDIYQGTEFWDFSLVDPDNRRPVDFALRSAGLDVAPTEDLARSWRDGRIKQALIHRVLTLRRNKPDLFADGGYEPLAVTGRFADHIIAFERRRGADAMVTVAPRVASALLVQREIGFRLDAWGDTTVMLRSNRAKNIFDGQVFGHANTRVAELFGQLPFALLVYSTSE